MGGLKADAFTSDPRVIESKRLLLEALADHQKDLSEVQPLNSNLKVSYTQLLEEFAELRGGPLFYPYLGSGFGNHALVELADGSVKYDFITGIGVHSLGHCHPALVEASFDAAIEDTIMQGNLQQNSSSVPLFRTLIEGANRKGADLKYCFLSTSGVMANENALKIIFQKKHPASRMLAFENCFMGRTLAISQVTDKPEYRQGLPPSLQVDYVPFFDGSRPDESTQEAVTTLKRHLSRHPGEHAGMVFELVQGEGGFYPGERNFFVELMKLLKEAGAAILIDEVQTFGRTTELFAFQHFGLDEWVDVVTIGKSSQVCATIFREEFRPKPGLVSQTFTASTSAILASRAILDSLLNDGFYGPEGKMARLHAYFEECLKSIEERLPNQIKGPYGIGGMIAFAVFDGSLDITKKFLHALFGNGVVAFYAGSKPTRVRFLIPAGAISFEDIDVVSAILERTLEEISAAVE
jgi:4-aminobutyrate aminotransferase-like enzyme